MNVRGTVKSLSSKEGRIDEGKITDAVITKERLSIEYVDSGKQWYVVGHSEDGFLFRGTYNTPDPSGRRIPDPARVFELRRCLSSEGTHLFGEWENRNEQGKGLWILFLEGYKG